LALKSAEKHLDAVQRKVSPELEAAWREREIPAVTEFFDVLVRLPALQRQVLELEQEAKQRGKVGLPNVAHIQFTKESVAFRISSVCRDLQMSPDRWLPLEWWIGGTVSGRRALPWPETSCSVPLPPSGGSNRHEDAHFLWRQMMDSPSRDEVSDVGLVKGLLALVSVGVSRAFAQCVIPTRRRNLKGSRSGDSDRTHIAASPTARLSRGHRRKVEPVREGMPWPESWRAVARVRRAAKPARGCPHADGRTMSPTLRCSINTLAYNRGRSTFVPTRVISTDSEVIGISELEIGGDVWIHLTHVNRSAVNSGCVTDVDLISSKICIGIGRPR